MSTAAALFVDLLRRLVRLLFPILGGRIDRRVAFLRAQIARLPEGHRRRSGLALLHPGTRIASLGNRTHPLPARHAVRHP